MHEQSWLEVELSVLEQEVLVELLEVLELLVLLELLELLDLLVLVLVLVEVDDVLQGVYTVIVESATEAVLYEYTVVVLEYVVTVA